MPPRYQLLGMSRWLFEEMILFCVVCGAGLALNPHFLFNTLNAVSALVAKDSLVAGILFASRRRTLRSSSTPRASCAFTAPPS